MDRWIRRRKILASGRVHHDPAVTAATFADVGLHFRLHRRTHGRFGLETWAFLTHHLADELFAIGRLQFELRRMTADEPQPPVESSWVLDVHIPSSGPLLLDGAEASFAGAATFFARHFPDRPAAVAVCLSWLLDPYLAAHLCADANIVLFQKRFQPYGAGIPSQADVVYFVFRTRDVSGLDRLPRDSVLQRLVLDRIAAGGTWQFSHGFRVLPPPAG